MKKMYILVIVVMLITCLAGCGSGGGGSNDNNGTPVTDEDIKALLNNYAQAVDVYNVDGMLACLDSKKFTLTITQGSYRDTKDYKTLEDELNSDKDNQLAWREATGTVTNGISGHNYKLVLNLGTAYSSNETSIGAIVKQTFEVWESSDEITTAIMTDSGNIVWTLEKSSDGWKATAMTINYSTTTSASLAAKGLATMSSERNKFGLGKLTARF